VIRLRLGKRAFLTRAYHPAVNGDTVADKLWPVWSDWEAGHPEPPSRIRMRVYGDRGLVTEFCVQLEYNTNSRVVHLPSNWMQVARFDHNISPTRGHDIRDEGLHMDLYDADGKTDVLWNFPTVPLRKAPKWCRNYLQLNHERLLAEFEDRLKIPQKNRVYES